MPLERASIGSDEWVFLVKSKSIKTSHIPLQTLKISDRPLEFAFYMIQGKLVGHNATLGFILLVLSSSLVLLAIFYLFIQLFNDNFTSFIALVIFSLLPNKLEGYSCLTFFYINIVMIVYILSLVSFIFFTKTQRYIFLILSLFGYCVGIFWYGIGFFIPLVFAAFSYLYKKEFAKYSLYFVIPAAIYVIYRLTGVFGFAGVSLAGYNVDLSGIPKRALVDLFHHYFGRYMIRNIIYGFYKFISIEQPWLLVIICLNALILLIVFLLIKRGNLSKTDNSLWIFGAVLFFVFLLPFFLMNKELGMAERYLLMPSLGVAIIIICFLQKMCKKWQIILFSFIFVALIVCQGNAWSQVVALRINAAIFQTMNELRDELNKADNIIVDVRSMADKIPFTLVQREENVLNMYYGASVYHSMGLESMLELVVGKNNKTLYVATESPRLTKEKLIEFSISEKIAYRQVRKKTLCLPKENTVIIDFATIYGEKFNNGIKEKTVITD